MRKIVFTLILIAAFSTGLLSSEFGLNFNIKYNSGNSSFFGSVTDNFWSGGFNYTEKSENLMGMGVGVNFMIPLAKNLYVVPGIGIDFGHQSYEFKRVEEESDSDLKDTFYFNIIRTDIKLYYDFLRLKNGWKFTLIGGTGYSSVKSDTEINIGENKFWNLIAGIGIEFFQLKHFGFYLSSLYNYPLKNRNFEYITFQSGIIYKF